MAIKITQEARTAKSGKAYLVFTAEGHAYGMPIWIAPDKATLEAFAGALLQAAKTAGVATAPVKAAKPGKAAPVQDPAALLAQLQGLMAQLQAGSAPAAPAAPAANGAISVDASA